MSKRSDTATSSITVDEPAPGVKRMRIGNESHRGALAVTVLTALEEAVRQTAPATRCLLLTGSENTFSAGYDLAALDDPPDPEHADRTIAPECVGILSLLEQQPLPVVVAVNGPALGGGLELVLAGDLRIAVPSACLGAPAGRLGLVYSPRGLERVLAEVPFAVASELFLCGGTISAQRAHELGLFSQIVAPEQLTEAAVQLAAMVAQLAPISVRANRTALRALRGGRRVLQEAERVRLEEARTRAMRSQDFVEGVRAFREHREPRFSGT